MIELFSDCVSTPSNNSDIKIQILSRWGFLLLRNWRPSIIPENAHATASAERPSLSAFWELRVMIWLYTAFVPNGSSSRLSIGKLMCKNICLEVSNAVHSNNAEFGVLSQCHIQLLVLLVFLPIQENSIIFTDIQRILSVSEATQLNFLDKSVDLDICNDVVCEVINMPSNCSISWLVITQMDLATSFCTRTLP